MPGQVIITDDGSSSIWIPELNESYHSRFGARQESLHVFINAGLKEVASDNEPIYILEVGFGTGLNALLTLLETANTKDQVVYETIEPFPIGQHEIELLVNNIPASEREIFRKLHEAEWEKQIQLGHKFRLIKHQTGCTEFAPSNKYHLIYFDAFSPEVQPELWTLAVFSKLFDSLEPAGILCTYCSKGYVRRNMLQAGFKVEKLAGPKGKREILRARKPSL